MLLMQCNGRDPRGPPACAALFFCLVCTLFLAGMNLWGYGDTDLNPVRTDVFSSRQGSEYILVFGDSRDWHIWRDWCGARGYSAVNFCVAHPDAVRCSPSEKTNLLCLQKKGNSSSYVHVIYWMMVLRSIHPITKLTTLLTNCQACLARQFLGLSFYTV